MDGLDKFFDNLTIETDSNDESENSEVEIVPEVDEEDQNILEVVENLLDNNNEDIENLNNQAEVEIVEPLAQPPLQYEPLMVENLDFGAIDELLDDDWENFFMLDNNDIDDSGYEDNIHDENNNVEIEA